MAIKKIDNMFKDNAKKIETEGFEPSVFRIKNECLSIWLCFSEKCTTFI